MALAGGQPGWETGRTNTWSGGSGTAREAPSTF